MAATPTARSSRSGAFVGHVVAKPAHGPVGTPVSVEGKGLPAHTGIALIWETYDAAWSIEQRDGVDWEKFLGVSCRDRQETLQQATSDAEGRVRFEVEVPEDYGGMHDLYLVEADSGRRLNKTGFRVDVSAELETPSGPLGSTIALTVYGINPAHPFEGWYQLFYDNRYVGNLTAVTTRGTARVEIPATGEVGPHLIQVQSATFGHPFLQHHVSPYYYVLSPQLRFELTPGDPVLPPPAKEQLQLERPAAPSERADGPTLWTDYAEVPARSAIVVHGAGFAPGDELALQWADVSGDRVTEVSSGQFGTGFSPMYTALGKVTADDAGRFRATVVPESVQGGAHPIQAWRGEACLAQTYATLGRRPYPIAPKAGPVGTEITVELDGVGWTEHENEVALCYDNSYVGYACGADLMGKVVPQVYASGAPGPHYIDVYPTFRNPPDFAEGRDHSNYFRRPILTWRDHPHGFHVRHVFTVEKER